MMMISKEKSERLMQSNKWKLRIKDKKRSLVVKNDNSMFEKIGEQWYYVGERGDRLTQEIYDYISEQCKTNSKLNQFQIRDNIKIIIHNTSKKFSISEEEAEKYYREVSGR